VSGLPGGSIEPYKLEVFMQCHAATLAWNRAFDKLMTVPPAETGGMIVHGFSAIGDLQAFLVAAGILSDLFFPDSERADSSRGQALCTLYGVKPDSPLTAKKVRNSFVHVDERLDKWLRVHAGKAVGPFAIQHLDGPAPTTAQSSHLRIVDTKNWRVMVRGDLVDLLPLLREIGRIGAAFPLEVDGPGGKVLVRLEGVHVES
jgi:hypothetical protein